ncbi:carboxylate--amine ligase [Candidatus Parcubacteria bacterium]|nr:carboxylate--amine ligase [Candidatus Parcubacteria bacterium]
MKRILTTGAGGSPSTNFIRSIRAMNKKIFIIGTDSNEFYLNRSEADKSYLAPFCNSEKYFDFLNYLIEKHNLEFMHIQNDSEMEVVSKFREKLNIKLFLPSKETVACCMNKYETYKKWLENGIKVPKTYFLNNVDDLKNAYKLLGNKIWLREISGAGGKGSLAPKNFNQAKIWIDFKEGWGKFTAAELLTSNSITWMSIWNKGELVVAQGRKRLYWELGKVSPSGISGVTGAGITVSDSELDRLAIKSIKSIDSIPDGIFSVDFTYDFSKIPNPTEINIGRFFTTHEFFTKAGLNMPEIYIKLAYGEPLPKISKKINPLENGLIWIRGVDFLPVLTRKSKLEKDRKIMNNILKEL